MQHNIGIKVTGHPVLYFIHMDPTIPPPSVSVGNMEFMICRWFYDSSEGVCHEFSYGGKKGNGNRFLTRQDCEANCQPSQVRELRGVSRN